LDAIENPKWEGLRGRDRKFAVYEMRSSRLTYQTLSPDHAPGLLTALGNAIVNQFLIEPEPVTLPAAVNFVRRLCAGPPPDRPGEQWLNFSVFLGDALIGRLEATTVSGFAEVAYLFSPAHWGRGFATEAVAWLQAYCSEVAGVAQFWAAVPDGNVRSIRVLERLHYVEQHPDRWPNPHSFEPGCRVFRNGAA
jgi:RimJ/RimL family protein N-acetyltransferase